MGALIDVREVLNDGVKRSSPFSEPVPSESIIGVYVEIGMEEYVVDVLGREFYDVLVEEKGGRVSIYNPNDRKNEEELKAFPDNEEYEGLWVNGGLRMLCGWAVAVVSLRSIGSKLKQGGVTKLSGDGNDRGSGDDSEDRLLQNWERMIEVLSKKVKGYLSKKVDLVGFEEYKKHIEELVDSGDSLFREVGILKLDNPSFK